MKPDKFSGENRSRILQAKIEPHTTIKMNCKGERKMTVKELTSRLWYLQEIEIVSKRYEADKEKRIVWKGENMNLRASDPDTVFVRNMLVISFGIVDNKLIIIV